MQSSYLASFTLGSSSLLLVFSALGIARACGAPKRGALHGLRQAPRPALKGDRASADDLRAGGHGLTGSDALPAGMEMLVPSAQPHRRAQEQAQAQGSALEAAEALHAASSAAAAAWTPAESPYSPMQLEGAHLAMMAPASPWNSLTPVTVAVVRLSSLQQRSRALRWCPQCCAWAVAHRDALGARWRLLVASPSRPWAAN